MAPTNFGYLDTTLWSALIPHRALRMVATLIPLLFAKDRLHNARHVQVDLGQKLSNQRIFLQEVASSDPEDSRLF